MKRLAILPLVLIGLSACGGGAHKLSASQQQALQPSVTKAEATFNRCAPNPFGLVNKTTRHKFLLCAVPPQHRKQFERCLINGALSGGFPTKAKLTSVGTRCLGQVA